MKEMIWRFNQEDDIEDSVRRAFRDYWNVSALAQSPLAGTSLVEGCLLTGDALYPDARGYALRATFDWVLGQLQGQGTSYTDQSADVLEKRYIKGMSNKAYADLRWLTDSGAQERRKAAIQRVVEILGEEIEFSREVKQRKDRMIALRYQDCSDEEQRLLRLLAIFPKEEPLSIRMVTQLFEKSLQPLMARLLMVNLLLGNDDVTQIKPHPEIYDHLLTSLTPDERSYWNVAAAEFYEQEGKLIEQVYYLQQANQPLAAAELLIEQQDEIGDGLPLDLLQERLADFQKRSLPADRWAQIKILAGRVAELAKEVDLALSKYEEAAFSAEQGPIQAEAYYRLACLLEQKDIDTAFMHYDACQKLLSNAVSAQELQLLANVYIRRAWLFVIHRFDKEQAEENLEQAQRLIVNMANNPAPKWYSLRSDLHTTWATLYARRREEEPNIEQEHQHRVLAWQYARQAGDIELAISTAHNLALMLYFVRASYAEARRYFRESQQQAQQAGNLRMAALNDKGIGGCYFLESSDYEKAISHYTRAYNYFSETSNQYWLANVCYDLAEAYAAFGNSLTAKEYFDEGISLAEKLKNSRLQAELTQLTQKIIDFHSITVIKSNTAKCKVLD